MSALGVWQRQKRVADAVNRTADGARDAAWPKFETDEEEIAWLLEREGNEKIEPLLEKLERKAREQTAERVRQAREEEAIKAAEAVRQAREEEAATRTRMSLYAIFDARGLVVSDAVRERIESCNDADQLAAWITRAVTATSADDAVNE